MNERKNENVVLRCFCSGPQPLLQKQRDPKQQRLRMIQGWGVGFTLIELLVVVLIIGVLSAIAVPQYQKAVEKARIAEAVEILHTIRRACQLYELAGNDCGDGHLLEYSDISWPSEITTENCADIMCINTKYWQYFDNTGGDFGANRRDNDDWQHPHYMLWMPAASSSPNPGQITCWGDENPLACKIACGSNGCEVK